MKGGTLKLGIDKWRYVAYENVMAGGILPNGEGQHGMKHGSRKLKVLLRELLL
jgi:hypothetical protein